MLEQLVSPKEGRYFAICAAVSALIYLALIVSIVGISYILFGAFFFFVIQGLAIGRLRGCGVRVSERQFPDLHRVVTDVCARLELPAIPEVYVLQEGGLLNAFATRFFGRNFVVVFSDILELAYEHGEEEVAFVIAHEIAHLKRNHIRRKTLLYPAMLIPFVGVAYSRACEYTADAIGAYCTPAGAARGLLVLAAGKRLYREVDVAEFMTQADINDAWTWLAEKLSTHPNLCKRLVAVGRQLTLPNATTVAVQRGAMPVD